MVAWVLVVVVMVALEPDKSRRCRRRFGYSNSSIIDGNFAKRFVFSRYELLLLVRQYRNPCVEKHSMLTALLHQLWPMTAEQQQELLGFF